MSPHNDSRSDDDEFDAFLEGKGELAKQLQRLPQPVLPVALSEVILSDAEQVLKHPLPPKGANVLSMGKTPVSSHFLRRAWAPIALAASVLFAVIGGSLWQRQAQAPVTPVVAQTSAPEQPAESIPPVASHFGSTPDNKPDRGKRESGKAKPAPTIIAQADVSETAPGEIVTRSGPSEPNLHAEEISPSSSASQNSEAAPNAVDNAKAKAWITLIGELIKSDMNKEALEEWGKFRKEYPHYPVPDKLNEKIKSLNPQTR